MTDDRIENVLRISGTDVRKCMKCGKCSGRCPAYKDMDIKPHQFVTFVATGKFDFLKVTRSGTVCLAWRAWNVAREA